MTERTFREGGVSIPPMPASEIRQRFLDFFAERGHEVVPSASLVPAGDQTLLFTNSGMVQFKEVLTGAETRSYKRAVDCQRCLRVAGKHNDFEEVGRTTRHHTFFEMLGNWSFGDYFKREAIQWAMELLTQIYKIPFERLGATTYKDDEDARRYWREVGMPEERMAIWGDVDKGDDNNFWRMADTGPCGPCSEIHFDRGAHLSEGPHCIPDHSENCPRWLEIWNLVFMEFDQPPDGPRVPLPFKSVDTGMGFERLASVLQGVNTNYDTDIFTPIHEHMRSLLGHDPETFEQERFSYQVIADHVRALTFLVPDGVRPSNDGRGYVMRRILRRAVRHGRLLGRTRAVPCRPVGRRGRHDEGRVPVPERVARRRSTASSPPRSASSRARSTPASSISRRRSSRSPAPSARSVASARRTCRPTLPSCPATSRSACMTRTASRST